VNEPDLNKPGKPMIIRIDGVPHELEQTKFQNCQDLMTEVRGRFPTEDDLARWALTKREYDEFILQLHEHERFTQDEIVREVAAIERNTGETVRLPKLEKDRLGLRRLKTPPEASTTPDETSPPGREPPPGISWGDGDEADEQG
jgi:hypothetical protein